MLPIVLSTDSGFLEPVMSGCDESTMAPQQKRNLLQIGAFQLSGTSSQDGNVTAQMDWETQ